MQVGDTTPQLADPARQELLGDRETGGQGQLGAPLAAQRLRPVQHYGELFEHPLRPPADQHAGRGQRRPAPRPVQQPDPEQPTAPAVVMFALESLGVPALSLAYAATVVLLWQDPKWQQRLMPFSFVGRMALTNYLLQSLIFTTIFYSYGFGWYGRFGALPNIFFAVIVYLLQIPLSQWWLSRHRYGPVEWLWRLGTYGRINLEPRTRTLNLEP